MALLLRLHLSDRRTVKTDNARKARRHVTATAEVLWPPPSVCSVTRRSHRATREWLVLPSLHQPRWLLPARSRLAAQALERHDLGARAQMLSGLWATLYRHAPLDRLPITRIRVETPAGTRTIEDELSRLLAVPVNVCVRLGRSRQGRALVLRAIDDEGLTRGFVKMGTNPHAERALRIEAANLQRLRSLNPSPVIAPRVLSLEPWNTRLMLVMSALLPRGEWVRKTHIPDEAMFAFAQSGGVEVMRLRDAPFVARQKRDIEALTATGTEGTLKDSFSCLLERYGDQTISIGCWHGDWVPWNMAWAGDAVQLWDWEHYSEGVPVGWDWLHFHAQHLRTRRGTGPRVERQWLADCRSALRRLQKTDDETSDAVILSYLLDINVRYLMDRRDLSGTVPMRKGWGLPMVKQLTRGTCA